jgi:hypothetical protein
VEFLVAEKDKQFLWILWAIGLANGQPADWHNFEICLGRKTVKTVKTIRRPPHLVRLFL